MSAASANSDAKRTHGYIAPVAAIARTCAGACGPYCYCLRGTNLSRGLSCLGVPAATAAATA